MSVNMFNNASTRVDEQPVTSSLEARFAFGGAVDGVLRDHYLRDAASAYLSAKFKLYYRLRPFIPIPLRQLLQRGRNQGIDVPANWYLPTEFLQDFRAAIALAPNTLAIDPWPDRYKMAGVLTHDVETSVGVSLVDKLAQLEEKFGLRSSWNFIPYKYKVDSGLLHDLKQRGHEIGVHGYNHDGRLFESRRTFDRRVEPINRAIASYGSTGFRAPMVHRNLQWLQALDVEYDASCFDVDPFQAMPGGVGGMWPFIVGKFVELPYTLPQDHTLLVSLGETTPNLWIKKFDFLRRYRAMAMLVTHPDYLDTPNRLGVYQQFLQYLSEQTDCWHALPQEVADWWRQRDRIQIAITDDFPKLVGPAAERAKILVLGELAAE